MSLQQHPVITFWSIKVEMGSRGCPLASTNGEKCLKMTKNSIFREMAGKGGVIDWSNSLSIVIIATAPGDNIFVNESGGEIKGSPIHRHKW